MGSNSPYPFNTQYKNNNSSFRTFVITIAQASKRSQLNESFRRDGAKKINKSQFFLAPFLRPMTSRVFRSMSSFTMSSGDLPALISKWLKKREKCSRQRYLWTLCRSVVPWRCTTRFRLAVRSCQPEMVPRCFPIPCPQQDSEGEKSRPLDHMRQIPLLTPQFHLIDLK